MTKRSWMSSWPGLSVAAVVLGSATLGLTGCARATAPSAAFTQVQTDEGRLLLERVRKAYDPEGKLAAVTTLRFDYVLRDSTGVALARARHLWDRTTGAYRYEVDATEFSGLTFFDQNAGAWKPMAVKLPAGTLVAVVNLKTRTGSVTINGEAQPASVLALVLDRIDNDTKWLLLPLETEAEAVCGLVRDDLDLPDPRVRLLTPQAAGSSRFDQWTLTIGQDGRVLRTVLTGPGAGAPVEAVWEREEAVAGVRFVTRRALADRTIVFDGLATTTKLDAAGWESTEPQLK